MNVREFVEHERRLTERMVENTRCVDDLPAQVFVIRMTDVQRFGCERVRLHFDVGTRHLVQETRLAHIGIAADEQRACIRINRW